MGTLAKKLLNFIDLHPILEINYFLKKNLASASITCFSITCLHSGAPTASFEYYNYCNILFLLFTWSRCNA